MINSIGRFICKWNVALDLIDKVEDSIIELELRKVSAEWLERYADVQNEKEREARLMEKYCLSFSPTIGDYALKTSEIMLVDGEVREVLKMFVGAGDIFYGDNGGEMELEWV